MKSYRWALLVALVAVMAGSAAPQPLGDRGPVTMQAGVTENMVLAASVAFVTAISIVGSAYAVGRIGSAALGAAAEKPELLTRSILFVALAEGLAVLGFAVAMMLVAKMT
jgi:V/A-type H+-transporting ATPase subunit K